jgi:hypothetical protein
MEELRREREHAMFVEEEVLDRSAGLILRNGYSRYTGNHSSGCVEIGFGSVERPK